MTAELPPLPPSPTDNTRPLFAPLLATAAQGGGNCANALTAAARLGLAPALVTKIGGDSLGEGIVEELQRDGVDTSLVLRGSGQPSPFTYIIVDRQGAVW